MQEKIPCTVGILTFNSAATLRRALESVRACEDIVVCDGGSTDDTRAIAREYGCRIIEQDSAYKREDGRLADYSGVRNQCLTAARYPYFFYIDSDESASPELIEEMRRIAREGKEDGYRIPIRMWIGSHMVEHSSNYPGYQYRIVRTDRGVYFRKPVHERPEFGRVLDTSRTTLQAPWYVYLEPEYIEHYLRRNWKFVELERQRSAGISVITYLTKVVPINLRSVVGIVLRTLRNRILYPWKTCMPLSVEFGRVRYHLALIRVIGAEVLHI